MGKPKTTKKLKGVATVFFAVEEVERQRFFVHGFKPDLGWTRIGSAVHTHLSSDQVRVLIEGHEKPSVMKLRGFVHARGLCEGMKKNGKPCGMKKGLGWVSGHSIGKEPRLLCPGHWRSTPSAYRSRPTSVAEANAERAKAGT